MSELPILNTATLWDILNGVLSDQTVNRLVWQALGYRYDPATESWDTTDVAAEWAEAYPQPPDFMGSRPATVKLTRSIPTAHKQLLKEELGFTGYKVGELNPTLTRRATAANWLLSFMKVQEAQI
jgi:hypothetical protein